METLARKLVDLRLQFSAVPQQLDYGRSGRVSDGEGTSRSRQRAGGDRNGNLTGLSL